MVVLIRCIRGYVGVVGQINHLLSHSWQPYADRAYRPRSRGKQYTLSSARLIFWSADLPFWTYSLEMNCTAETCLCYRFRTLSKQRFSEKREFS